MTHTYLIALGSNMRVPGLGHPRIVLEAAIAALDQRVGSVLAASTIIDSAPIGPSLRRYANAAAIAESALGPPGMLAELHKIENAFGRGHNQRRGARWRARALDLDIVLWSGGIWESPGLLIPHAQFRTRDFVLRPASEIVGDWRDPITSRTIAQLAARNRKSA